MYTMMYTMVYTKLDYIGQSLVNGGELNQFNLIYNWGAHIVHGLYPVSYIFVK